MADNYDLNLGNIFGNNSTAGASNGAGQQLIDALNNVSRNLQGMQTTIEKFNSTSRNYSNANPELKQRQSEFKQEAQRIRSENARASNQRATNAANPDIIRNAHIRAESSLAGNTSKLNVSNIAKSFMDNAEKSRALGNEREARRLEDKAIQVLGKGIKEGFKNSGINGLVNLGTALSIGGILSKTVGSYYGYNTQLANAGMVNPLSNGYNYGGPLSSALSAAAHQQNAEISGIITAISAGIGGLIGGKAGAGVGAAIGGLGTSILSSAANSKADIQAQAKGLYLNQLFSNQALMGSNANAAGMVPGIASSNPRAVLNPLLPLYSEISKGAGVYTRNFKAMEGLTTYAVNAQLPLQEASKLAGSTALLGLNNSQFFRAADLASNAGVSVNDVNMRTLLFQQGGLSLGAAQNAAGKSFSSLSGFQAMQEQYFGGSKLSRFNRSFAFNALTGGNLDRAMQDANSPDAQKLRNLTKYSSTNPVGAAYAELFQVPGNAINPNGTFNMSGGMSRVPRNINSRIGNFLNEGQSLGVQSFESGTVDAKQISQHFDSLISSASSSSESLSQFSSAVQSATDSLNNLNNRGSGGNSTRSGWYTRNTSGSTSSGITSPN